MVDRPMAAQIASKSAHQSNHFWDTALSAVISLTSSTIALRLDSVIANCGVEVRDGTRAHEGLKKGPLTLTLIDNQRQKHVALKSDIEQHDARRLE
jgi:hypothetical protein